MNERTWIFWQAGASGAGYSLIVNGGLRQRMIFDVPAALSNHE
jgi:hypothetical protein